MSREKIWWMRVANCFQGANEFRNFHIRTLSCHEGTACICVIFYLVLNILPWLQIATSIITAKTESRDDLNNFPKKKSNNHKSEATFQFRCEPNNEKFRLVNQPSEQLKFTKFPADGRFFFYSPTVHIVKWLAEALYCPRQFLLLEMKFIRAVLINPKREIVPKISQFKIKWTKKNRIYSTFQFLRKVSCPNHNRSNKVAFRWSC